MNRDELAIGVTNILYKLYSELKVEGKNVSFFPSIKDQNIAKNGTPNTPERFAEIVHERDSIVKFDLSVFSMVGDYTGEERERNDTDKVTVIISDDNKIELKIQYEYEEERFKKIYEEIKSFLEANSNKEIVEENVVRNREIPIKKICDFGILGTFPLLDINFETDKDYSKEEIDNKIEEIVNQYNKNIESINKRIFTKIFNNCIFGSSGAIELLDDKYFSKIINEDKLPLNYNELSDDEKLDILFKDEIDESDFDDIENSRLKMFNFDKIKNNCRIYNVTIDEEYKKISIELYFLWIDYGTAFCQPWIEMDYANNFEVTNFDPGL